MDILKGIDSIIVETAAAVYVLSVSEEGRFEHQEIDWWDEAYLWSILSRARRNSQKIAKQIVAFCSIIHH